MKQIEILDLAMEALILKKLEPGATEEKIAEIDKQLRILGKLYAEELFKPDK